MHIGTVSDTSSDLLYESTRVDFSLSELASRSQQIHGTIVLPRNTGIDCYRKTLTSDQDPIGPQAFMALISDDYAAEQLDSNSTSPSTDDLLSGVKDIVRLIEGRANRIIFTTEEGHVGALYHPDPLVGVQSGDVVVGLFGTNVPFVLRPVPKMDGEEQTYTMVNLAYVAGHKCGHEFVANPEPGAKWEDSEQYGLREYTIA